MAQEGIDKLLAMTDSRYRLSMIVARRAAQIKVGIPSVLPPEERPKTRNTVTVAMKEIPTGRILWGEDLPSIDHIRQDLERERVREERYSSARRQQEDEED